MLDTLITKCQKCSKKDDKDLIHVWPVTQFCSFLKIICFHVMFNKLQMTHVHQNKLNWHIIENLAKTFLRCPNQEQVKLIECPSSVPNCTQMHKFTYWKTEIRESWVPKDISITGSWAHEEQKTEGFGFVVNFFSL